MVNGFYAYQTDTDSHPGRNLTANSDNNRLFVDYVYRILPIKQAAKQRTMKLCRIRIYSITPPQPPVRRALPDRGSSFLPSCSKGPGFLYDPS